MALNAQNIESFNDGTTTHIRWKGAQKVGLTGYTIYLDNNGSLEKIVETKRLVKNKDIRKTVGAKTELFLKLAGASSADDDFSQELYDRLVQNNEAYMFFGAMTVFNIEMADALGEYIKIENNGRSELKIRIMAVVKGEEQLHENFQRDLSVIDKLPAPSEIITIGGDEKVNLSWKSQKSEGDLYTYKLYRATEFLGPYINVNPLGTVNFGSIEDASKYTDLYLDNGVKYYYYLRYFNIFGMEGDMSEIVEATPHAVNKSRIENFKIETLHSHFVLSWDSLAIDQNFKIYRKMAGNKDFELIYPISSKMRFKRTRYLDREILEGKEYYYFISSENERGTAISDTVKAYLEDTKPPEAPKEVKGTVDTKGIVKLSWKANSESDILGYEVERFTGDSGTNNFLLTAKPLTLTSFSDNLGSKSESAYRYVIYALDNNYNRSKASEAIRLRRPDDIAPDQPIITHISFDEPLVHLRWTEAVEDDFRMYKVYRRTGTKWMLITETNMAYWSDTVSADGLHEYRVSAVDHDNNESKYSESFSWDVRLSRIILPPTNASLIDSGDYITLKWKKSETSTVVGYLIERIDSDGKSLIIKDLRLNGEEFVDRYIGRHSSLTYKIVAYDKDWYVSEELVIQYNRE